MIIFHSFSIFSPFPCLKVKEKINQFAHEWAADSEGNCSPQWLLDNVLIGIRNWWEETLRQQVTKNMENWKQSIKSICTEEMKGQQQWRKTKGGNYQNSDRELDYAEAYGVEMIKSTMKGLKAHVVQLLDGIQLDDQLKEYAQTLNSFKSFKKHITDDSQKAQASNIMDKMKRMFSNFESLMKQTNKLQEAEELPPCLLLHQYDKSFATLSNVVHAHDGLDEEDENLISDPDLEPEEAAEILNKYPLAKAARILDTHLDDTGSEDVVVSLDGVRKILKAMEPIEAAKLVLEMSPENVNLVLECGICLGTDDLDNAFEVCQGCFLYVHHKCLKALEEQHPVSIRSAEHHGPWFCQVCTDSSGCLTKACHKCIKAGKQDANKFYRFRVGDAWQHSDKLVLQTKESLECDVLFLRHQETRKKPGKKPPALDRSQKHAKAKMPPETGAPQARKVQQCDCCQMDRRQKRTCGKGHTCQLKGIERCRNLFNKTGSPLKVIVHNDNDGPSAGYLLEKGGSRVIKGNFNINTPGENKIKFTDNFHVDETHTERLTWDKVEVTGCNEGLFSQYRPPKRGQRVVTSDARNTGETSEENGVGLPSQTAPSTREFSSINRKRSRSDFESDAGAQECMIDRTVRGGLIQDSGCSQPRVLRGESRYDSRCDSRRGSMAGNSIKDDGNSSDDSQDDVPIGDRIKQKR